MSEFFSEETILDTVKDALDDGYDTLEELQDDRFNLDTWIIGTYKAAKALEQFDEDDQLYTETMLNGVFGAIEYVQTYEKNEFGKVNTDLSDPEQLANMVAYINSEMVIGDICDKLGVDVDDELIKQQEKQIMDM